MKVLSKITYLFCQRSTHRNQCFHWMQLRHFGPQEEIMDNHVNQKDQYPDANVAEDADIFNKNLQSAPYDAIDDKPEVETDEIKHGNEIPPVFA